MHLPTASWTDGECNENTIFNGETLIEKVWKICRVCGRMAWYNTYSMYSTGATLTWHTGQVKENISGNSSFAAIPGMVP